MEENWWTFSQNRSVVFRKVLQNCHVTCCSFAISKRLNVAHELSAENRGKSRKNELFRRTGIVFRRALQNCHVAFPSFAISKRLNFAHNRPIENWEKRETGFFAEALFPARRCKIAMSPYLPPPYLNGLPELRRYEQCHKLRD